MIFVEGCAGTAALTFRLFGAKRPIPMAGSKDSIAQHIIKAMGLEGQKPERVILIDAGEWGKTLAAMFHADGFETLAGFFDRWQEEYGIDGAKRLFDELRRRAVPGNAQERAAAHLYMQTRTYRGKPVYTTPDSASWVTHGFDPEFRLAKTKSAGAKDRGWFNARPTIARKLRDLATVEWPPVTVIARDIRRANPVAAPGRDVVLYLDPPYQTTEESATLYGNAPFSRQRSSRLRTGGMLRVHAFSSPRLSRSTFRAGRLSRFQLESERERSSENTTNG